MSIEPPFYPVIYVRGYAMTEREIAETVSTPYMGLETGATKMRQTADGTVKRFLFESPLVRLMKDYGYRDVYQDGSEIVGPVQPRSIVIHRYYERADPDLGKSGAVPSIEEAAEELGGLIVKLKKQVCGDDAEAHGAFRVYLVAHSMGGLVCRCLLQNPKIGASPASQGAKAHVAKVFTYATPHNGIEFLGVNVPSFLSGMDMNNFNRDRMRQYLALAPDQSAATLTGPLDASNFFCLVGTNSKDYAVAMGLSRAFAGELSDGLVRIENAAIEGGQRAFVHRSHSGFFGIVNSEEGYQNLTRFLFGNIRVKGTLQIDDAPLPPDVEKERKAGRAVQASYYVETVVSPRGAYTYDLTRRTRANNSAILAKYDEFAKAGRQPTLFSVFLDTKRILKGGSAVFSVELAVSTTGYEIDHFLLPSTHVPGEYLFRNTLVISLTPPKEAGGEWSVSYAWGDDQWAAGRMKKATVTDGKCDIPVQSGKGFDGILHFDAEAAGDLDVRPGSPGTPPVSIAAPVNR